MAKTQTLFNPKFYKIFSDIYGINSIQKSDDGTPNLFKAKTFLYGTKVTNCPFNFYPPAPQESTLTGILQTPDLLKASRIEVKSQEKIDEKRWHKLGWAETTPFISSVMVLSDQITELKNNYSKNLRQNINRISNKALKQNLIVQKATDIKEIRSWHNLFVKVYRDRHKMICHPFSFYKALWEAGMSDLFICQQNGHICGGVVILKSVDTNYYAWGATHPNYMKLGVSSLLLHHAAEQAINEKKQKFDFGTTPPSDTNLLEFKRRWGCKQAPVYHYLFPAKHGENQIDLNTSYETLRTIYKYTPIFLTKPFLRLGIREFF